MAFLKGFVLLMAVAAVWAQECTDNSPDNELTCPELIGLGGGVCDQDFIKRDNFCARSCGRSPCPSVDLSSEGSVTLIGKVTGEKQDAGPPPATTQTAPAPAPTPAPTPPPPPPPPPPPAPTPPAEVPEMTTEETVEVPEVTTEETTEVAEETTEAPVEVPEETTETPLEIAEDTTETPVEVAEETTETPVEVAEETTEAPVEVAEETEPAAVAKDAAEDVVVEEGPAVAEVAEVAEQDDDEDEEEEEEEEVAEEAEEPEAPVDCKPVLDLIAGDGELSFLKSALDGAGLSGSLAGFNGIIFAPTNNAFEALLSVLDLSKDAFFAGNSQVIQQLLQVHVVPGAALTLEELSGGQSLTPLLGDAQKVSVTEGGAIASPDGKTARIAKSLNEGCPAVIHIIDNVLIPRPASSP